MFHEHNQTTAPTMSTERARSCRYGSFAGRDRCPPGLLLGEKSYTDAAASLQLPLSEDFLNPWANMLRRSFFFFYWTAGSVDLKRRLAFLWLRQLRSIRSGYVHCSPRQERVARNAGMFLEGLIESMRSQDELDGRRQLDDPGPWRQQAILSRPGIGMPMP